MTTTDTSSKRDYLLSDKLYDILTKIAQVLLPALGALYFALAEIWGLPNAEEVLGTIAAFGTFLGVIISLGNRSYNNSAGKYDGEIDVTESLEGPVKFDLVLNEGPETIIGAEEIRFKVNQPTTTE